MQVCLLPVSDPRTDPRVRELDWPHGSNSPCDTSTQSVKSTCIAMYIPLDYTLDILVDMHICMYILLWVYVLACNRHVLISCFYVSRKSSIM